MKYKNPLIPRKPRTLAEAERLYPHIVHFTEFNRDPGEGCWIHLRAGYFNPQLEAHTIHEGTVAEVLEIFQGVIICDCPDECHAANMKKRAKARAELKAKAKD